MSVDLHGLRAAVARHGRVARVVIAGVQGSAPREAGAAMLVWAGGQSGTIGGGALEYAAAARARTWRDGLDRMPLGPALGQCCGGAVTLLTEVWDEARLARAGAEVVARPLPGAAADAAMPLAVRRIVAAARQGIAPRPGIVAGWMVEPVSRPERALWIWGAGHVGRAIAGVAGPLPGTAVVLADTCAARLPDPVPDGVTPLVRADLAAAVAEAPGGAEHLVLTFSHALDLELCHRILSRDFGGLGLIGSASKAARFRSRLAALGHPPERIGRMVCPIGEPALGKHPQAIAVGVVARLLGTPLARSLRDTA